MIYNLTWYMSRIKCFIGLHEWYRVHRDESDYTHTHMCSWCVKFQDRRKK